jgi:transposase-like protein
MEVRPMLEHGLKQSRGSPSRFTDQQKQEAVELINDHFWKVKWVAEKYGVRPCTIHRWRYELGNH